ncbi:hypothetical protein ABT116_23535 [Streptomyces sp. NPDC002130]|uniref:hypothetical protein n=1 Tax=Streptomyces sp. NPDC002130 TaxID=3155568 RepID=UPI00332340EB
MPDRLYLRAQCIGWDGEIVVSVFVHAALAECACSDGLPCSRFSIPAWAPWPYGDIDSVRGLLEAFRADIDCNAADFQNATVLRPMADSVDTSPAAPDTPQVGTLRGIAQALPALVLGTAAQQGGEALANAIGGLVG